MTHRPASFYTGYLQQIFWVSSKKVVDKRMKLCYINQAVARDSGCTLKIEQCKKAYANKHQKRVFKMEH